MTCRFISYVELSSLWTVNNAIFVCFGFYTSVMDSK